jgi:hypothetical protein
MYSKQKALFFFFDLHTKSIKVMASHSSTKVRLLFTILLVGMASAHLSSSFYDKSYPEAFSTIKSTVVSAVRKEAIYGN